ncbi:MAG: radical SAM protein, partial [Candidatus Aenigmatarchaeota archaeon]
LMKHDYRALAAFHHRSLFIGMMHFMDLYNYDINRVKRCCVHYLTPEAVIPFCAFNVIPEWYRDRVQNKYGISFKKWEAKSGKKLKADVYRRDIEKLKNSDLYRKTYEGFVY